MACSMNEHLVAYLDGELAGPLHEEVARHVAHCPECAHGLKELVAVREMLPNWCLAEPKAEERAQAWQKLQGARRAPHGRWAAGGWPLTTTLHRLARYALPVAAGVLVTVLVTISWERRGETGAPEEMLAQLPLLQDMDMLEVYDLLTEWDNLEALTALEEAPANEEGTRQ